MSADSRCDAKDNPTYGYRDQTEGQVRGGNLERKDEGDPSHDGFSFRRELDRFVVTQFDAEHGPEGRTRHLPRRQSERDPLEEPAQEGLVRDGRRDRDEEIGEEGRVEREEEPDVEGRARSFDGNVDERFRQPASEGRHLVRVWGREGRVEESPSRSRIRVRVRTRGERGRVDPRGYWGLWRRVGRGARRGRSDAVDHEDGRFRGGRVRGEVDGRRAPVGPRSGAD